MTRERIVAPTPIDPEEDSLQLSLRPKTLDEYIGQNELRGKLRVALDAAQKRKEAVEHILFYGPPGLGKTTLAHIIANEMNTKIFTTAGPALHRRRSNGPVCRAVRPPACPVVKA